MNIPSEISVGVDAGKFQLDIFIRPLDQAFSVDNSAAGIKAAIQRLKEKGARDIKLVCLLSAPEGIKHVSTDHPDVQIFTAAIDRRLDGHGYIVPGLGDAGDRMFGTK